MDIEIGGNLYRNTDGTVEIEGAPQIEISLKGPNGPLMVNFVVVDQNGRLIAKVVKSSMFFNESRAYSLSRTSTSVVMTEGASGKVVLQVELKEPDCVAIRKAEFITLKGHVIEVTPVDWRIGTTRSSQGDSDSNGGAIALG